jgi:hypothetical protein
LIAEKALPAAEMEMADILALARDTGWWWRIQWSQPRKVGALGLDLLERTLEGK